MMYLSKCGTRCHCKNVWKKSFFPTICWYISRVAFYIRLIATITVLSNVSLKLRRWVVIGRLIKGMVAPERGRKTGEGQSAGGRPGKCYGNDAPPFPRFCIWLSFQDNILQGPEINEGNLCDTQRGRRVLFK